MVKNEYLVSDLVIDDEYGVIDSNATVEEAAKKMKQLNVPDLVVLDKDEKVLGVIADFDIIRDIVAEDKNASKESVLDHCYTITPVTRDTTVVDAFTRMRDLHVAVVPVVEDEKLLGVCTIQDVWSYIPDERPDEIGVIAVKNPKNAEFWFASICSLLAFILGIMLPLAGITGYFTADVGELYGLSALGEGLFSLFRAGGLGIEALISKSGGIWALVLVLSYVLLIIGTVGIFSLLYVSYSDARFVKTHKVFRTILPFTTIGLMILQWILYLIAFGVSSTGLQITLNVPGLIFTILSILLILAAIARDWIFKQQDTEMTE
ncbi:MAG: CBS domain-containing protein [Promethearchaeota archaeon]|nr:MAG: CBS domain-containing protein [Candidatus Lokiarchaeota archaeon]